MSEKMERFGTVRQIKKFSSLGVEATDNLHTLPALKRFRFAESLFAPHEVGSRALHHEGSFPFVSCVLSTENSHEDTNSVYGWQKQNSGREKAKESKVE